MKTSIPPGTRTLLLLVLPLAASFGGAAGCGSSGSSDAGHTNDGGSGPQAINGCTSTSYVDYGAPAMDRTITFGGLGSSPALGYSPKCMTITVGESVTFSGMFSAHPLLPGSAPTNLTSGSPNNPIGRTASGSTAVFVFSAAGTYPYFCENHYASGMTGAIFVH